MIPACRHLFQDTSLVCLDTMNGITDLIGLTRASQLEDLIVVNSRIEADVFDSIIACPRPNRVTVGLASRKAEEAVEARLGNRATSVFGTTNQKFRLM